ILRNSVDHGIESQEKRQELGKPTFGTIKVWAARQGNQVVIRIADDGTGLDYEMIRANVRALGIQDNIDEMSDEELALNIFQPGFTTSEHVTQSSGRGVGLDVVKENIESLKGFVSVHSVKDQGVQFTIRIPLTLAVAEALLFRMDTQQYAVSLNDVNEVFRYGPGSIPDDMESELEIEGEVYQLFNLRKMLNTDQAAGEPSKAVDDKIVLLLEISGKRVAVSIENMIGKREIVIKSLGSHLKQVKGVSGATILGDGGVVPILNIEELIGGGAVITEGEDDFKPIISKQLEILIVDDSVSVRQVVARLMENQGWKTQTAKDGVEALERIRESKPDLIVLDIEMPRMNGYEFLNAMNVQSRFKNTPVVMLTSRATSKHREKAMSLGARGFVVKPYKDDEFIDIVMRLTGVSS
ncbi:MAG: response regulator, partial [Deltaproteobacteria bacterium]|nr:response regulator [Deltaproteobacteria bacterium]